MVAKLAIRRPEAVRELEALQQEERKRVGEPTLSEKDFRDLLLEDVKRKLTAEALDKGGMSAFIEAAGSIDELAERKVADLLHAWRVDDPSQWSRYENPGGRYNIANNCGRIEAVFARHNWPLTELPVVGTLTTGKVSAVTQKTSTGSPLVLIDNGFFLFSGVLSQLAVFASYDAQVRGNFSEFTLQLMSDLVATHTVLNTCLYLYRRTTPPDYEPQVASFQDAVSVFVMSHEYAHISVGDLDAHPFKRNQEDSARHSQEFEADKIGFITTVEATSADEPGSGVFGPFLYLAGLDVMARAAAAYEGQAAQPLSDPDYPTPFERTMSLLTWLETSPYKEQFGRQIRDAYTCYNTILFVWDQILPAFWAARDELSAFDPAKHGPSRYPDADTFGVVTTLWQHVLARLGQT